MSDTKDNSMLWNHRPPVRQRRPGDLLWKMWHDHASWTCELFFRGESVGWEAQIFRNGELVIGRTFLLKEYAVRWTESEKADLEKGGALP